MTRLGDMLRIVTTSDREEAQRKAFEALGRRVREIAEGSQPHFFDDPAMGYPAGKAVTLRACAEAMVSIGQEEGLALPTE
jgi:hypothetical protein